MIGIVTYGSGNIAAIENVLRSLGRPFLRIEKPDDFLVADRLILPGVGAFDTVMSRLRCSGLIDSLEAAVLVAGKPVLGICVGMQILANGSEEGHEPGLGWIPGRVRRVDVRSLVRKPFLPHMGWNSISVRSEDALFEGIDLEFGFYFLHSYYFEAHDPAHVLAAADYGNNFTVAVRRANIHGVQFHPEKSHRNGIRLIANFAGGLIV